MHTSSKEHQVHRNQFRAHFLHKGLPYGQRLDWHFPFKNREDAKDQIITDIAAFLKSHPPQTGETLAFQVVVETPAQPRDVVKENGLGFISPVPTNQEITFLYFSLSSAFASLS